VFSDDNEGFRRKSLPNETAEPVTCCGNCTEGVVFCVDDETGCNWLPTVFDIAFVNLN
jgi:hypothetical protein